VRRLLVAAAAAAALAAGAAPVAHATNECRGLQVCVRVAGPWVAVPAGRAVQRPQVEFQLSCPRGYVVGGLDAELSDRALDVTFLGKLGSPVNPGITTSRTAVFVATYAGRTGNAPTFRPHIGCVPAAGGGGGPVPYRVAAASAAAPATVRRVTTMRVRAGATQRIVRPCAAGERLVRGVSANGFYTPSPPAAALIAAVRARLRLGPDRVAATVQSTIALQGVRAVIQVTAVCGGGR
jgi:hypothetical protein